MSLLVDPPFALGQTLGVSSATDGTQWEGAVKLFPDVNPTTGQIRSNRVKKCIAVRNSSGSTLYGKRAVSFVAGSTKAVSGYVFEDGRANKAFAGVSDEHLSGAGVAANDIFWVTVDGPTELRVNVNTEPGQHVVGTTINNATAYTDSANTGGYAITATPTAAQAAPTGSVVYYGRVAVTASTTVAQAGVLVHVKELAP